VIACLLHVIIGSKLSHAEQCALLKVGAAAEV
jgi:hypothetical protein